MAVRLSRSAVKKITKVASVESVASYPGLEVFPITSVTNLTNGLRVASEPSTGETATIGVWVDTGSRYETEENNGVAHFLEHMFFKGTTNRSQYDLEVEIENMGGHLNAYTSREQTVFYAKVHKKDVPKAMEILSDILLNSKFEQELIDREKDTILREMQEVESQTEEVVFDRLHETAYRGCALGRTILGPIENIKKMDRATIKNYVDTHYTAPRMVVAGAGAINHEELVKLADQHFGSVSDSKAPIALEPGQFTGSLINMRYDDMPEVHIAYALPTNGWTDSDTIPFMVMQAMIGNWDASVPNGKFSKSPLISGIANSHMAQSIMSFNLQYSDTGLFGVYAVTEPQAVDDLMYNIQDTITSFAYEIDEDHLAHAKKKVIVDFLSNLDGSTQICEEIGRQMLIYGRRMHPTEMIQRVEAVSANAIIAAAKKHLQDQCFALAAIGPTHGLGDYAALRQGTSRWTM